MPETPGTGRQFAKAFLYGFATLGLYSLLYLLEQPLLEFSAQGGWYFVVPVALAFLFSLVHGAFTGHFWDVLGIKAKK